MSGTELDPEGSGASQKAPTLLSKRLQSDGQMDRYQIIIPRTVHL